jgi:predicted MPP superfamily phosphohydrolase
MFIAIFLLFLAANIYVIYRLWHLMPPSAAGRTILLAAGIVAVSCCFLYFAVGDGVQYWFKAAVYRTGISWLIIIIYVVMAFLLMDILRVTRLIPMPWMATGSWTALAIFTAAVTLIMGVGNIVYHNKKRVEITLTVDKDTGLSSPFKILAVSDLHLGYGIDVAEFGRWVDMINAEKPDLILIAGDAVDTSVEPLLERGFADVFRRLDAGRGVYAVPGNHEYISGIDQSLAFMKEAGVTMLRDSAVSIAGAFYIAGRDDRANKERRPLSELMEPLDRSKPVIVVDHQPLRLEEAEQAGADFQISGHTHYGQVWPISWITKSIFEQPHGYLRKGGTQYWISSGLGIWGGKFRLGTRSEYVVIRINPAG